MAKLNKQIVACVPEYSEIDGNKEATKFVKMNEFYLLIETKQFLEALKSTKKIKYHQGYSWKKAWEHSQLGMNHLRILTDLLTTPS